MELMDILRRAGLTSLSWVEIASNLVKMLLSALLVLPVGINRQRSPRNLGFSTFPLVAVASCSFVLLGVSAFSGSAGAQARIVQGLITGIGFLGGGAIVKDKLAVHGTATAASIWGTAALGAAVAFGRIEMAVVLAVINYSVLRYFKKLRAEVDDTAEEDEEEHEQKIRRELNEEAD